MLLAEDLLLLLTNDDTGKLAASSTEVDVALGGALLVELTLMQRVDVAGPDERVREGRLVVRDRRSHGRRPAGRGADHRWAEGRQEAPECRGTTREAGTGPALRAPRRGWCPPRRG